MSTMNELESKIVAAGKQVAAATPDAKSLAAARRWWREGRPVAEGSRVLAALLATPAPGGPVDQFVGGDACPVHGMPHRKVYTFGSTMSAETEVCTFAGCGCAVSIVHDPVGTYDSQARYHRTYAEAAGKGKLNAALWAAKFRD